MICLNCEREIQEGQEFCPDCGERIDPEAVAAFMRAAEEAFGQFDTHHDACPAMEDLEMPEDLLEDVEEDVLEDALGAEDMSIPEVLDIFANQSARVYPRAAVEAALAAKEEITPHLLQILREVCDDPEPFLDKEWDMRSTYAVLLLGYFRESRAHGYLVDLLSFPGETAYELFGDGITEDFSTMLVRTYPGSPADLFRLIRNGDTDQFCRHAGFSALALLAAEGRIEREVVVQELGAILSRALALGDWETATACVNAAYELHPAELMPQIRTAYEQGLVETFVVGPPDIERVLRRDLTEYQQEQLTRCQQRHSEDFHSWVSWWATYTEGRSAPTRAPDAGIVPFAVGGKSKPEKKAAAKRKAARKARRRNRKRKKK